MTKDNREPSVIALIEQLEDVSYSDHILFGHQNAGHIGVSIKKHDGSESDVKNLTGKHPGVVGVDTLGFYGYEGKYDDLVKTVKQLHKEGVIITLSSHMPNFSLGGDEFFDYSPNITDGNIGERILPGGDLNAKYRRFMDRIADFAHDCVDISGEYIPMIFRPFHEDNGDWFWWGRKYLPDDKYIELFRYTVDYLCNEKNVKNFAFAYSPNGPIPSAEMYMRRYPGDDYIDILGVDIYHDRPRNGDGFWDKLTSYLEVLSECAMEHGKVYAITEIGPRALEDNKNGYFEGLAPSDNNVKDWYTALAKTLASSEAGLRCAYFLTWANFSDTQFWVPYKTDDFTHEMCDDFVTFSRDPHIKLAP